MNEKEKKRKPNGQREREIGIFSMLVSDSVTSTFLGLLVNKSNRKKLKKAKLKTSFQLRGKKVQNHFCLESSVQ